MDGNWKDGCLGTGWMDGMIGDRIKFFFQLNWFNMHGVLIFCLNAQRGEASHMLCFFWLRDLAAKPKTRFELLQRVFVKCPTDLPLPKHGNSSRCELQAVAKRRFGGDLATIAKVCLSGGTVVETEPAPLGLEFVSFFKWEFWAGFFSSFTHPFFLGQWKMRQPLRRRFVELNLLNSKRGPCRQQWQLSNKFWVAILNLKLKPRQRVPGNENGPMYL